MRRLPCVKTFQTARAAKARTKRLVGLKGVCMAASLGWFGSLSVSDEDEAAGWVSGGTGMLAFSTWSEGAVTVNLGVRWRGWERSVFEADQQVFGS